MSQAVTKSIPAPTHAEWTATITGLGHWERGKKKEEVKDRTKGNEEERERERKKGR